MTFLVLDSATARAACAIFVDQVLVMQKDIEVGLMHTKLLMPAIADLCEQASILPSSLQFIAPGIGPGSFTGIRVACAIAKGMAAGLSIPLVGISSLRGFIAPEGIEGHFIGAIDARMGGIFCIEGRRDHGAITFLSQEELVSPADFSARIIRADMVVTPSSKELERRIDLSSVAVYERAPDLEYMGKAALEIFRRGEYPGLELLYLRATQAEIERDQKR